MPLPYLPMNQHIITDTYTSAAGLPTRDGCRPMNGAQLDTWTAAASWPGSPATSTPRASRERAKVWHNTTTPTGARYAPTGDYNGHIHAPKGPKVLPVRVEGWRRDMGRRTPCRKTPPGIEREADTPPGRSRPADPAQLDTFAPGLRGIYCSR